jgi:hypothetical protein
VTKRPSRRANTEVRFIPGAVIAAAFSARRPQWWKSGMEARETWSRVVNPRTCKVPAFRFTPCGLRGLRLLRRVCRLRMLAMKKLMKCRAASSPPAALDRSADPLALPQEICGSARLISACGHGNPLFSRALLSTSISVCLTLTIEFRLWSNRGACKRMITSRQRPDSMQSRAPRYRASDNWGGEMEQTLPAHAGLAGDALHPRVTRYPSAAWG